MATTPETGAGHPVRCSHRTAQWARCSFGSLIPEGNQPFPGGLGEVFAPLKQRSNGLPICTTRGNLHHRCTTRGGGGCRSQCFFCRNWIPLQSCWAQSGTLQTRESYCKPATNTAFLAGLLRSLRTRFPTFARLPARPAESRFVPSARLRAGLCLRRLV